MHRKDGHPQRAVGVWGKVHGACVCGGQENKGNPFPELLLKE